MTFFPQVLLTSPPVKKFVSCAFCFLDFYNGMKLFMRDGRDFWDAAKKRRKDPRAEITSHVWETTACLQVKSAWSTTGLDKHPVVTRKWVSARRNSPDVPEQEPLYDFFIVQKSISLHFGIKVPVDYQNFEERRISIGPFGSQASFSDLPRALERADKSLATRGTRARRQPLAPLLFSFMPRK